MTMLIDIRGIKALQKLRIEIQESAGLEYPDTCLRELLVLCDVCKYLGLSTFQAKEVLGAHGYDVVTQHFNSRVEVNHAAAIALGH